ncbi:MAG: tetratricopeptide repeat protein [Ferruginibacter sp.]|nr:tetratricopeptide repeat protein [Chitinophagaceae bacterium]
MKKTTITFLAAGLLLASGLKAQTIQEGLNHLYADRFKSAIAVFEKLLATNPNNIDATYWLGQTYFDMDDNVKARQLYDKALASNGSAPLILVGLGHADLHDNKTSDARQKFEAAITASRGKKGDDPGVTSAIARANVDAKAGDAVYAVQKLEPVVDRGEKSTEALLQLGNAYRKAKPGEGGGQAFETYKKALQANPAFAVANLRLAKLFESQKNWELVLKYLNDAVTSDPKFAPAYYELFYYYFFRLKYPEAEEQLTKFIANSDPDPQHEFLYAQLCWAKKDFACAIAKAESVITAMGQKTKPKVYKLLADANFQKGDYTNAKKYTDLYFAREKKEDIISMDYKLLADILSKTGGTVDEIYSTYMKGAALDTVLTSRIDFIKQGAEAFKTKADSISRLKEGDLRMEVIKLKPNPSQRDYFDAGFAYYQGSAYLKSDSLFAIISTKYPDDIYGPQMQFAIARILDSTMAKGSAVPHGVRYLTILEKDTAKNKKAILSTAGYLAQYYANIAKDNVKAVEYFRKMLALNPDNADVLQKYVDQLEGKTSTKPTIAPKGNAPPKATAVKTTKTTKKPTPVKSKNTALKK